MKNGEFRLFSIIVKGDRYDPDETVNMVGYFSGLNRIFSIPVNWDRDHIDSWLIDTSQASWEQKELDEKTKLCKFSEEEESFIFGILESFGYKILEDNSIVNIKQKPTRDIDIFPLDKFIGITGGEIKQNCIEYTLNPDILRTYNWYSDKPYKGLSGCSYRIAVPWEEKWIKCLMKDYDDPRKYFIR